MDERTRNRRLFVALGVCVSTFFGLAVSLHTGPEERTPDIKIVYVPEDNRGEVGPPGPSGDQVLEAVRNYCRNTRCQD